MRRDRGTPSRGSPSSWESAPVLEAGSEAAEPPSKAEGEHNESQARGLESVHNGNRVDHELEPQLEPVLSTGQRIPCREYHTSKSKRVQSSK